jgi:hypothetical protein
LKQTIGNENLHEIKTVDGITNFATYKNLTVKSTMFPHRNTHKFNWTTPHGKRDRSHFDRQETTIKCTRFPIFQRSGL